MARFSSLHRLRHWLGSSVVSLDYGDLRIMAHSPMERYIRAYSARKEPETVEWLESLVPGSILWDVGANIGAYSLIAAANGVMVYAFEPSPVNFNSLVENIMLNDLPIIPLNMALGSQTGLCRMQLSSREAGAALHVVGNFERGVSVLRMSGRIAIGLGIPKPDYLKLDTDGGEEDVLEGLGEYLKEVKGIMVELPRKSADLKAFHLKGRWPIPGFDLENRCYIR